MGYLLKAGEDGNSELAKQRKAITEKWGKLGLLDGLKGKMDDRIAKLYECCPSNWLDEERGKTK